jgi:hypothetical protein
MLHSLPFSFRKESEAALIGHVTERRGNIERAQQSKGERRESTPEQWAERQGATLLASAALVSCSLHSLQPSLLPDPSVCVVTRLTQC